MALNDLAGPSAGPLARIPSIHPSIHLDRSVVSEGIKPPGQGRLPVTLPAPDRAETVAGAGVDGVDPLDELELGQLPLFPHLG